MVYFILSSILTRITDQLEEFCQTLLFLFVEIEFDIVGIVCMQVVAGEWIF